MPTTTISQRLARLFWRTAPTLLYSRAVGILAGWELPLSLRAFALRIFARMYGISLDEAEFDIGSYPSLQAFFTRRLKPGLRPIASEKHTIVAPSDGTVCDCGIAQNGTLLHVKGSSFSVQELLAVEKDTDRFLNAPYLIIYLSPRDYHRVHAPVSGTILGWTHLPGSLYPVGPASVAREPGLFAKNERFIIHLDTEAGACHLVMVAAVGVGNITCTFDSSVGTHGESFNSTGEPKRVIFAQPIPVEKGSELATFNLGSTTISLFESKNVTMSALQNKQAIKMGEPIGRMMVL